MFLGWRFKARQSFVVFSTSCFDGWCCVGHRNTGSERIPYKTNTRLPTQKSEVWSEFLWTPVQLGLGILEILTCCERVEKSLAVQLLGECLPKPCYSTFLDSFRIGSTFDCGPNCEIFRLFATLIAFEEENADLTLSQLVKNINEFSEEKNIPSRSSGSSNVEPYYSDYSTAPKTDSFLAQQQRHEEAALKTEMTRKGVESMTTNSFPKRKSSSSLTGENRGIMDRVAKKQMQMHIHDDSDDDFALTNRTKAPWALKSDSLNATKKGPVKTMAVSSASSFSPDQSPTAITLNSSMGDPSGNDTQSQSVNTPPQFMDSPSIPIPIPNQNKKIGHWSSDSLTGEIISKYGGLDGEAKQYTAGNGNMKGVGYNQDSLGTGRVPRQKSRNEEWEKANESAADDLMLRTSL